MNDNNPDLISRAAVVKMLREESKAAISRRDGYAPSSMEYEAEHYAVAIILDLAWKIAEMP